MSQSKLQVFTKEANPILESYFNTLLGQEVTFKSDAPAETALDQVKTGAESSFTILGKPVDAEPFIIQLEPTWIPVISNAMVGREMSSEDEGVQDLAGQIISQSYKALQSDHSWSKAFPGLEVETYAPESWTPDEALTDNFWSVPFSVSVDGQALAGQAFVSSTWLEGIEAPPEAATPDETAAEPADVADAIGVKNPQFPDFGRENLQTEGTGNFDLLAEVELNVTVELGRRKIPLSEVLKLTTGSVIELEKLVGEPLEIFANGRLIAEGEAVVIEEQFGIRITNLASNKLKAKSFA